MFEKKRALKQDKVRLVKDFTVRKYTGFPGRGVAEKSTLFGAKLVILCGNKFGDFHGNPNLSTTCNFFQKKMKNFKNLSTALHLKKKK